MGQGLVEVIVGILGVAGVAFLASYISARRDAAKLQSIRKIKEYDGVILKDEKKLADLDARNAELDNERSKLRDLLRRDD